MESLVIQETHRVSIIKEYHTYEWLAGNVCADHFAMYTGRYVTVSREMYVTGVQSPSYCAV